MFRSRTWASRSIMEEDPSVKELLAEQMKLQIAAGRRSAPEFRPTAPTSRSPRRSRARKCPDFRGKSMRDVVQQASADGIEVMVEGSGVARAQVPLPGQPLRPGERIRIVFTR